MLKNSDYLLDTHVFLWSLFSPKKLSKSSKRVIKNSQSRIFVSAITFWEISLKFSIGKLNLENYLPHELPKIANEMGFELMPLSMDSAATFHLLPRRHHKDPFDRMLVWQAIKSGLILISSDRAMKEYAEDGLNLLRE